MKWNILLAVPVVATALIAASIPASAEVKHQDHGSRCNQSLPGDDGES